MRRFLPLVALLVLLPSGLIAADGDSGPVVGAATGKDLEFACKLPKYLTAVIDPKAGVLFLTTEEGTLKHYSYPDFKFLGDYILPKGQIPYRAALDAPKGVLYLAVMPKDKLRDAKIRRDGRIEAAGDILAFDVMHLLDKKGDPGNELKVATEYKVGAVVRNIVVTPEGDSVFFLDVTKEDKVTLVRINTKTKKLDGDLKLEDKTELMCLTPDGKTLYTAAATDTHGAFKAPPYKGFVQKIDPATLKETRKATIAQDPGDMVANNDGLLFIAPGSGQRSEISVVDMKDKYSIIGHWVGVYYGAIVLLSHDSKTLYVATRFLSPPSIEAWPIPGTIDDTVPQDKVSVRFDKDKPLGGTPYMSPDGKCILCPIGSAWWTAAAKKDK